MARLSYLPFIVILLFAALAAQGPAARDTVSCSGVSIAAPDTASAGDASPSDVTGSSGDISFAVLGDNRPGDSTASNPPAFIRCMEEIRLIRPDMIFHTGDIFMGDRGSFAQRLEALAEVRALLEIPDIPWHLAPGNHELTDSQEVTDAEDLLYKVIGGEPYYSFDKGPAHFIILNNYLAGERKAVKGRQLEWLKRDLEASGDRPFKFVFMHIAMFAGPRLSDESYRKRNFGDLANRDELHALFARHKVHTVFCGHEHVYYRETRDGVRYVISGGAGANQYAEPQDGGFSHYVIASIKDGVYKEHVIVPWNIVCDYGVDRMAGSRYVILHNATSHKIPVRGIRFKVLRCVEYGVTFSRLVSTGKPSKYDGSVKVAIYDRRLCADSAYDELYLSCVLPQGGAPLRIDIVPKGFRRTEGSRELKHPGAAGRGGSETKLDLAAGE
jgi:hypothetical protein